MTDSLRRMLEKGSMSRELSPVSGMTETSAFEYLWQEPKTLKPKFSWQDRQVAEELCSMKKDIRWLPGSSRPKKDA